MSENLAGLWADTVARQPAAPAVVDSASGRSWTRADLAAAVSAQSAALPSPDACTGRAVVLVSRNSPGWLAMFLALLGRRVIPVALDPDEPVDAQKSVADQVGAVGIWRESGFESLPAVRRRRRPEVCLYKLTSGTTGTPRALAFTSAQMAADGRQVCASMDITPEDVNLAIIPFGHSYGLGNLVLPLLLQGTAIVIGSGALPQIIATDVRRWRPTVFPAVPALLRTLTRADIDAAALASLRLVISAGAALAPDTAAAFTEKFGLRVHGFYGSSETGGICYDRSGAATLAGRSVGSPLDGVRLTFRRGGRFVVESAAVMRRGRHAPPDRGEFNAHGELVLRGRVGRMVKVAGRRLDLGEVERALRAVSGVREVWACADPQTPEAVAAVVAGTGTPAELRAALSGRIAAWKIPDRLLVVSELPLTARGKVDSRALRMILGR
jgi:acyl-CoA synthetase (AMP-forming)/AMP-acid ligase II